jgi:hypothetical protein
MYSNKKKIKYFNNNLQATVSKAQKEEQNPINKSKIENDSYNALSSVSLFWLVISFSSLHSIKTHQPLSFRSVLLYTTLTINN